MKIETTDVKDHTFEKTPTIAFVYNPSIPSKSLLEKTKKAEMLSYAKQVEGKVGTL